MPRKVKSKADSKLESSAPKKPKLKEPSVVIPPVDAACPVKGGKVYLDPDNVAYSVVLNQTDILKNNNKYYKIQLVESAEGTFSVFRSWGRVGYNGSFSLANFSSIELAVKEFEKVYKDKTKNVWKSGSFEKVEGKYHPIEVDSTDSGSKEVKIETKPVEYAPSKLHDRIQDLLKILFDVESMKRTMEDHGLDVVKMPLGKLSKKQLMDAYKVLTDLSNLVQRGADHKKLIEASNKFYTLMPHNFGMSRAPVINNTVMIQAKQEMIDNLLQIEVACKILEADKIKEEVKVKMDPIDAQYEAMKVKMEPLDHDSKEFKMINDYMQNTHAPTHSGYHLVLEDVFKVDRDGERDRYKPFSKLHNRQLLWHGSRKTNFVGILSNGLKIAPKEAPVTGYMFGKGIYFADMCSKSANYCCTSKYDSTGLMLLSEVALGDTHDLTQSCYVEKLPKGKHSTKGIGGTQPDPKGSLELEDGTVVPMGKPVQIADKSTRGSLLYNEYIVYNAAQVNLKYLLKVKFNY